LRPDWPRFALQALVGYNPSWTILTI